MVMRETMDTVGARVRLGSIHDEAATRPARTSRRQSMRNRVRRPMSRAFTIEPLEPRQLLASDLLITELMASNGGFLVHDPDEREPVRFLDGDGNSSDWLEIQNVGDTDMDLVGYRLTDDLETPDKWTFPSKVLAPGEYLVVFASGQEVDDYVDPDGNLHTNFRLSAGGEYLAFSAPDGTIVSEFGEEGFPPQLRNVSFGMAQTSVVLDADSDAAYRVALEDPAAGWMLPGFDATAGGFTAGKAALGYEDRPDDRTNFADLIQTEIPSGTHGFFARFEFDVADADVINTMSLEMMVDNGFLAFINGHPVAQDNAPDNASWFSTASASRPRDSLARQFTEFPLTEHVDKLVDGTNVLAIHALNFLSDNSDMLLVPRITLGSADVNAAFGIESTPGFMTDPSPGKPNVSPDQLHAGFVPQTQVNTVGGFFEEPIQVEVTVDDPDATVYYTIDGSEPTTETGTVYSQPVTISSSTILRTAAIKPDFIPSRITTNSYIYLDDVYTQDGAGLPRTWGVMGNTNNGVRAGDPVPANYEVDPRVVNDPRYHDTLKDDLRSIPTMSLVLDPEDLWSEESGIYSNSLSEGFAWERPVSAELFNTDGELEFQIDAGVRIHGGWGRRPSSSNKHSFRLLFRNQYGAGRLEYPMFGEEATGSFDTFVLRANFNHSWATGGDPATTFINDQFAAETQLEMGYVAPHSNWVHLYLNGLYWGLYNPMERPSAPFAADYFGGDKENYDVLVVGSPTDGDGQAWSQLTRAARDRDYDRVQELLDIDAAIDYFIVNQYGGNWDWPQNNWYASRQRVDGAKWYFHSWDAEGMFGRGLGENRVTAVDGALGGLIRDLRRIEEFRVRYSDRIHKLLFNDGLLTPAANIDRLNRLAAPIDRAVVGESARWGDGRWDQVNPARTRDDTWLPRLEALREGYFPQRGDRVLTQFRSVDLYPDTDAPELSQHGGPVLKGLEVTIDNPGGAGTIYYTLDGTDPRLVGGDVAPGAVVYGSSPIVVDGDLRVMARVLNDDEWSALTEADFVVTGLRITEVNYRPHEPNPVAGLGEADVSADQFEFIELANTGDQPLDLTGVRFTNGIAFAFPDNLTLASGERTVVVKNREAFGSRYGTGRNIAGQFTGDLSDSGDLISLHDAAGRSILRFSYQTAGDWPASPNGNGSSLEIIDTSGSYWEASNWRASSDFGGSPGVVGTQPGVGVVINEILGHGQSPELDVLELYNAGSSTVNIQNWYLGIPGEDPFRVQITTPTTLLSRGYHVLSESDLGFEFDIAQGQRLWLVEADADGRPTRIATEIEINPSDAGISIGPGPEGTGVWLPLAQPTIGSANTGLKVGDVIISEINFDPADLDGQGGKRASNFGFIEIYNTTDQAIDLTDWRITGATAVDNEFDDVVIPPNSPLTLVTFSTRTGTTATIFRFIYGMDLNAPLVGRYRSMDADGGTLRLERPANVPGQPARSVSYVYVDEVTYSANAPWPTGASGTGSTLTRVSPDAYGNSPISWTVVSASPGSVDFTPRIAGDANQDGQFNQLDVAAVLQAGKYMTGQPATWEEGDWTGDGWFDEMDIVAALQRGHYLADANAARRGEAVSSAPRVHDDEGPEAADSESSLLDELFSQLGSLP